MAITITDAGATDVLRKYPPRSAVVSWIFFDWAAQPYFTLITTFVFAPYFATHVAADAASGLSLLSLLARVRDN
jgi:UMF1 family MFS transporter